MSRRHAFGRSCPPAETGCLCRDTGDQNRCEQGRLCSYQQPEDALLREAKSYVASCIRVGIVACVALALFSAVVLPDHADIWWPWQ